MSNAEIIYKEYKLKGYLDSKPLYKAQYPDYDENKQTILNDFKNRFNIADDQLGMLKDKYSDISAIKKKFTSQRREYFNNDAVKFYDWFKEQEDCCSYCGISQEELHQIFTDNVATKILPLNNNWSKNDKGTLQIERKDSHINEYKPSNMVLACPLCNNAKSNLIDEASWRNLFAPAMRKYYEQLLGKNLNNPLPK